MTLRQLIAEHPEWAERPSLKGCKAKCSYGGAIVDSDWSLAFFEYHPEREYDTYYCGCRGWD